MKFQSIKTSKLQKDEVEQILNLKDSHWKYGYESQLKWFKKNVMIDDYHNIMKNNNEIIGYTYLGERKFEILDSKQSNEEKQYVLFATLIIKKQFRNSLNAFKMMRFNSEIILKIKRPSFLLTHSDRLNFYKYFGWTEINRLNFDVSDHVSKLPEVPRGMVYNFSNFIRDDNCRYKFFYYS